MAKYSNFIMRVKCTVYTDRDYAGHTVGGGGRNSRGHPRILSTTALGQTFLSEQDFM